MVYFRKMDLVKIREERDGDGGVEVKVKGIYPKGILLIPCLNQTQ